MVAKKQLFVYGLLKNVQYHQAIGIAQDLYDGNQNEFCKPEYKGMLEFEWVDFVEKKRTSIGSELWSLSSEVIILVNDELFEDFDKFLTWAETNHAYKDYRPLPLWYAMCKENYKEHLLKSKHSFVYLDVEISSEPVGRLLIELYSDKCPRTSENFLQLCKGGFTESDKNQLPIKLSYKKSIFHRIVPNGWIQGGDFVTHKGTGGHSIHGPSFEDESFSVPHDKRGVLGMANKGRHTNASQFYITLQPCSWMNTKYVAFGQVIEGMAVLKILEEQETYNERPKKACVIANCGIFDVEKLFT